MALCATLHLMGGKTIRDSGGINTISKKHDITERTIAMTSYTSFEQLPLTLCAEEVAMVLSISRANAYTLMHSRGFPTIKIGKRMSVPKDKLIEWMERQIKS